MTRDEIREIAEIVGGDKTYRRFIKRINKEFDISDADRNANVYVKYVMAGDKKVGFSVIGHSPAKMRLWLKTFREEGWVDDDFKMEKNPFELMYMYIRPEYRGKDYGLRMFKKVISFTKKKRIKEIYAYVSDKVPTALEFYKKTNAEIIQDFSDEETTSAFLRWKL